MTMFLNFKQKMQNITASGSKILINGRRFFGDYDYYFDSNNTLQLTFFSKEIAIPLTDLQINGVSYETIGEALVALDAVFPEPGGATGETNLEDITTDVVITDASKGLVIKSPNGTQHRLSVNNDGSLTTTAL